MNSKRKRKGKGLLSEAARARLMAAYYKRQLELVAQMLDELGVPKWVSFADDPMPCSALWCRVKWYALRRKDVSEAERDLDAAEREMAFSMNFCSHE